MKENDNYLPKLDGESTEEKEIKILLDQKDFESIRGRAGQISTLIGQISLTDEYFDFDSLTLTNLNRGLRIRHVNGEPKSVQFKSLFYNPYTNSENRWFIEEISFPLPILGKNIISLNNLFQRLNLQTVELSQTSILFYDGFRKCLSTVGLNLITKVAKIRTEFENDEAIFMFDEVNNLGYFLEIEAKSGKNPFDILRNRLGMNTFVRSHEGYNDMLLKGEPDYIPNDTKKGYYQENPLWNVLPSEITLVQNLLSNK